MSNLDAQALPPGFVAQTFTPHTAASSALPSIGGGAPDVGAGLPPGFVPQAITDSVTGVVTPLAGMSALPSLGGPVAGGTTSGAASRRQSVYGNPNANEDEGEAAGSWGDGGWANTGTKPAGGMFSPYMSSSSPVPTGPPVIPNISWGGADDAGPSGGRSTPGQHPRSPYGNVTPGGSTRNLSVSGTPSGGGVYQNPLRQEEGENEDGEGEADDLLARNTRINATAPPIAVKEKKKKKGRR
ncbi:hypothetical protein P691DRAFT_801829 [Macrolepiota fuliginosa MF-IS2]|uniref:Uncharacterized protein n=1 Tax=Macrolepiota fuliginosa MF-IS2 TaxID=1400762 RepID=A0A9P6C1H3_9AGAR|nr:hypothetical protein P691DRAFT_801829 [Macrolepiota fuliginosa MF-IS2]